METPETPSDTQEFAPAAEDTVVSQPDSPATGRAQRLAVPGTILVLSLLVGGGVGYAIGHDRASSSLARGAIPTSFSGGTFPGGGEAPGGGTFSGGPGGAQGGGQVIQGTLTATSGTKITVKSSSGSTASYTVASTTQIVRDGSTAALADLKAGDAVLVELSSSSSSTVERLLAGTSASTPTGGSGGFGGPGGGQFGGPPGTTNNTSTTSTT